ncbi:MAG: hypothetical protein JSU78_04700 [Deltaproteobacteria bacterium]|nr:MAG: hypothetical protein JSU78_04700 [Deltaproteobacteria bacterium]
MLSIKRVYIIRVFLPVFFGGVIYCLLRDPNLAIFKLINNNTLNNFILSLQRISMPVAELFPRWFSYSLPDALWTYACISLILIYWREGPFSYRAFWIGIAIVLSLGFEVGQLLNIVPGTFCVSDLVLSMAAIALALSMEVFHNIHIAQGLRNTLSSGSCGARISG